MPEATGAAAFGPPDLTVFCRLDELDLTVTGVRLEPDRAVLACRVVTEQAWCSECGGRAAVHDRVTRRLAHEPFGWRPTVLEIAVARYSCSPCGRVWRQDTSRAAEPRARLSRRALSWALRGLVVNHLTVAPIARALGVSWNTANDAILAEGKRVLISDPARFEGVRVLGVDEHVWRHGRRGDKYVTVIIDLTPVRDRTGPARLLDMVEGRSKAVFAAWLQARPDTWRQRVEVVAMDGFTGFKTATADELPDAVTVMDPFHTVRLAGDALEGCRRRVQQELHGHRGRRGDPLFKARRTLMTGAELLTERQHDRLDRLFADDGHAEVQVTWSVYQHMVTAYRCKDPAEGKRMLTRLIDSLAAGVPKPLVELGKLGRTLNKRADDVLAYFDHPRTSNGPTEAINGRLEHLRGSALGFRNLTNYIARSLLETGGFRPQLHSQL